MGIHNPGQDKKRGVKRGAKGRIVSTRKKKK